MKVLKTGSLKSIKIELNFSVQITFKPNRQHRLNDSRNTDNLPFYHGGNAPAGYDGDYAVVVHEDINADTNEITGIQT